jgi:hypothetical protein
MGKKRHKPFVFKAPVDVGDAGASSSGAVAEGGSEIDDIFGNFSTKNKKVIV